MRGLTQTATLFKRLGRQNGNVVFSDTGTEFSCRIEEEAYRNAKNGTFRRNDEVRRGNEWCVFAAQGLPAEAGDCIEYGGKRFVVLTVRHMRCVHGVHHLEMTVGGEG